MVNFESALRAYEKTTKKDLTAHPLIAQLQRCDSPAAILTLLQDQVNQLTQSRSGDEKLQRWLNPTINVLYAFSATLSEGVGLVNVNLSVGDIALIPIRQVFTPANVICAAVGVLLLVSAPVYSLVPAFVTSGIHRRLRTSKRAKMALSIFSSASKTSFEDLNLTSRSHQLRR